MGVPIPPTLAPQAIPRRSGVGRSLSFDAASTAVATGNNIITVAVLEIHILKTALAAIKPNTKRRELEPPNALTIVSAIRR